MAVFAVAITGASGMPYARRTLNMLLGDGHKVYVVVSVSARKVLAVEEDLVLDDADIAQKIGEWAGAGQGSELVVLDPDDVGAPIASGSFGLDGMAVVPCSGGTLGRIAVGVSGGLIERAAEVCLKERRRLVLVTRETPLSIVQINNMKRVTEAGAVVLPAAPGFYHKPRQIADLVDMVASRIVDHIGAGANQVKEWRGG